MKKWQDLAPPDDPNSWGDVWNMRPTVIGTYKNVDYLDSGAEATATGTGGVSYAWAGQTLTGSREYVVAGKIWEYSAGAYTDRTGGVTIGTYPYMAQFGNVTICAMGAANATVYSTGGNFAALAGAPKGEIVVVQSNAVLIFNTDAGADWFAASDVGDHTNWTTGEAFSGPLLQAPGAITAAVPFGSDVIVFKGNAIIRVRYVGGAVKWASELVSKGLGCEYTNGAMESKYLACAGNSIVLFGAYAPSTTVSAYYYAFDGASKPVLVNPLTTVQLGRIAYDPVADTFTIKGSDVTIESPPGTWGTSWSGYFFNASSGAWGRMGFGVSSTATVFMSPLLGDYAARSDKTVTPVIYAKKSADKLCRYTPSVSNYGNCYFQTLKYGSPQYKTQFSRIIPLLVSRTNNDAGTATINVYRELHGSATQAAAPTESTDRARFDFFAVDNFATFKVAYGDGASGGDGKIEVIDIIVDAKKAGTD